MADWLACASAAPTFMLQDIDIRVWQENQMLVLEVDDLDAYWAEIDAKNLPGRFAGVRTKPPTDYPGAARCTSSIRRACAGTCGRARASFEIMDRAAFYAV